MWLVHTCLRAIVKKKSFYLFLHVLFELKLCDNHKRQICIEITNTKQTGIQITLGLCVYFICFGCFNGNTIKHQHQHQKD